MRSHGSPQAFLKPLFFQAGLFCRETTEVLRGSRLRRHVIY
jgi:hypothetical protein